MRGLNPGPQSSLSIPRFQDKWATPLYLSLHVQPSRAGWTDCGAFEKVSRVKQSIVTLDMEGVLTPEIWIAVAEKTRIKELRRTTRDEPDYDKLMRGRLKLLDEHGLKLSDIPEV